MTELTVKRLDEDSWKDFARLVEKNNGIWGGCWCMAFHLQGSFKGRTAAQNRDEKEERVRTGGAHAALVFDGAEVVGWCQFGRTGELPGIKLRRAYLEGLESLPDWRITCFFVDKGHRHQGVAAAALRGALREIARSGGGRVESYPQEVEGHNVSSSFLHNGTLSMFEREGFEPIRRLGKNHWWFRGTWSIRARVRPHRERMLRPCSASNHDNPTPISA